LLSWLAPNAFEGSVLTEASTADLPRFLVRMHRNLIDQHGQAQGELDAGIEEAMEVLGAARELRISAPDLHNCR
jgi:hypothetical protein